MKKSPIERAIDGLNARREAQNQAIDAAIAELRAQQAAKPKRERKPRAAKATDILAGKAAI